MKESDKIFTLQEIETLCQLYMECRLSVLEETELEYVLQNTSYTSPLVEDTRRLMALSRSIGLPAVMPKRRRRVVRRFVSAACISLCLATVGYFLAVRQNNNPAPFVVSEASEYMIAYRNGNKLDDKTAALAVNRAMIKADSLMQLAAEFDRQNLDKAQYIINSTKDLRK